MSPMWELSLDVPARSSCRPCRPSLATPPGCSMVLGGVAGEGLAHQTCMHGAWLLGLPLQPHNMHAHYYNTGLWGGGHVCSSVCTSTSSTATPTNPTQHWWVQSTVILLSTQHLLLSAGSNTHHSAQLRPGSCLLPQVGDLNRFIDYHLWVYVEILPKSREVMRRVRDHSVTTCCLEHSAVQRSDRVPFAWHYTASLLREHSISGSKWEWPLHKQALALIPPLAGSPLIMWSACDRMWLKTRSVREDFFWKGGISELALGRLWPVRHEVVDL